LRANGPEQWASARQLTATAPKRAISPIPTFARCRRIRSPPQPIPHHAIPPPASWARSDKEDRRPLRPSPSAATTPARYHIAVRSRQELGRFSPRLGVVNTELALSRSSIIWIDTTDRETHQQLCNSACNRGRHIVVTSKSTAHSSENPLVVSSQIIACFPPNLRRSEPSQEENRHEIVGVSVGSCLLGRPAILGFGAIPASASRSWRTRPCSRSRRSWRPRRSWRSWRWSWRSGRSRRSRASVRVTHVSINHVPQGGQIW
jgi:hypothetical protein